MKLSTRDCATLRALARDWNESDHPRGQPENAGEFASVTEINIHPKQDGWKDGTSKKFSKDKLEDPVMKNPSMEQLKTDPLFKYGCRWVNLHGHIFASGGFKPHNRILRDAGATDTERENATGGTIGRWELDNLDPIKLRLFMKHNTEACGIAREREADAEAKKPNYETFDKLATHDRVFLRALARDDFDPNEPRVASGPKGGEWTTGGGAVSMKSDMPQHVQTSMKATVKPAATSGKLHSKMIATRYSVSKKNPVNAVTNQPDLASMMATPEAFEHNMKVFQSAKAYPNFREEDFNGKTPEQVAHMVIDHFKANIRYLYDHADEATKKGGMIWYQTAHKVAVDFGKQYAVPEASAIAVVAALSPQKDWDQNIYLAQRVMSIYHGQQNHSWADDAGMVKVAKKIWKPKDQEIIKAINGRTLGELTEPVEKAAWIRTYDEAHSNREYGVFTGTGVGELAVSKITGKPKHAAWQALSAISSAIKCLEANDSQSVISSSIGDNHKVRSFYNNILDPLSPNKDVTIDTHAVGCALMRSLSSASAAVLNNFGNSPEKANLSKAPGFMPVSSSKAGTGMRGLYGMYAEAYRQTADELGLLPQQLQAIVWVQKRVLFEDLKDSQTAAVEGAWQAYHDGKATLPETQNKVMEISQHG